MLSWNIFTYFKRLVGTDLVWNCHTDISRNIITLLFRNIVTYRVGHLPFLGLGNILACLVWVVLTCSSNRSPDLIIALPLPLVLTVLLVLSSTLSLCVGLVLRLVLLHTHVLVHRLTFSLVDSTTLLPSGRLTQSLCLSMAHPIILSCTYLCLSLLVLSVP